MISVLEFEEDELIGCRYLPIKSMWLVYLIDMTFDEFGFSHQNQGTFLENKLFCKHTKIILGWKKLLKLQFLLLSEDKTESRGQ